MATNSLFHDVVINSGATAEEFIKALEKAERIANMDTVIYNGYLISCEDLCEKLPAFKIEQLIAADLLHPTNPASEETDYIFGDFVRDCKDTFCLLDVNDEMRPGRNAYLRDLYNHHFGPHPKHDFPVLYIGHSNSYKGKGW